MAAMPIEYTIYGHPKKGNWIAHQNDVSGMKLCTRILPVEGDAF